MAIDCTPYPEHRKLLETSDADHLAEIYLLQADLKAAHETVTLYRQKFLSTFELDEEEKLISKSLVRDGILLFCSCFSTKDPTKLNPEKVYGHLEGWQTIYKLMLDTRDSYVAHSFGPSRQHNIIAICLDIDGELVPAGMTQYYVRFAGWTAEVTDEILDFINVARAYADALVEEAEQPVLRLLETISHDELCALKDGHVMIPEREDIRSSRQRFRQSGRGLHTRLPERRLVHTIEEAPIPAPQREDPDGESPPSKPEPQR